MGDRTSISIDSDARDRLRSFKTGNETYTQAVERLLDENKAAWSLLRDLDHDRGVIDNDELRKRVKNTTAEFLEPVSDEMARRERKTDE